MTSELDPEKEERRKPQASLPSEAADDDARPLTGEPVLAAKDRAGKRFNEADCFTYQEPGKKLSAAG